MSTIIDMRTKLEECGRKVIMALEDELTIPYSFPGVFTLSSDLTCTQYLFQVRDSTKPLDKAIGVCAKNLAYKINHRNRYSPRIGIPKNFLAVEFGSPPLAPQHNSILVSGEGIAIRVMAEHLINIDDCIYRFDALCRFYDRRHV